MTHKERLERVIAGGKPDVTPSLGGWVADPKLLMGAAGLTYEQYAADPMAGMLAAHVRLGYDGMVAIMGVNNVDNYRIVDEHSYVGSHLNKDFDVMASEIEALPDAHEQEASFDFDAEYARFRGELVRTQAAIGDILYMPAQWDAGARASWYGTYGYENFFLLIGLRPDLAAKLFRIGGAQGYNKGRLIAAAVREGIYPKAVLLGEDVCTQRGPMISVDFLQEHYAPALARGLAPLLEAGVRPVWHCDGNVLPMLPMLLECGVQGLQGFQPECGMMIEELVKLRSREGNKLLIFGPMSITTELPVLDAGGVAELVRRHVEICRDTADLVYFTANTICPDVPLENLIAMMDTLHSIVL